MFDELLKKLDTSSDSNVKRLVAELAEAYDNWLLLFDEVPEEGVNFLVKIFSHQRVLRAQGIEHFLIEINVDKCKYTQEQLERILETLVENAGTVCDELARYSLGDFIARVYPAEISYKKLSALACRSDGERHIAFAGLDLQLKRVSKNHSHYKLIEQTWREILTD